MTAKAVAPYDVTIRNDTNTLIDRFIDRRECEFISEFGTILPGWAFFKNVLGVPVDDLDKLVQSVDRGTFGPVDERAGHFEYIFNYLGEYLEYRQGQPSRGDMVDTIAAGVLYENGEPAPQEHRVSVLVDITFGGIATTTYVMAQAVRHLAENHEDRTFLTRHPEAIPHAVEEFIRVFPPVVALGRTCTQDVEVHGVQFKKGDFVLLGYSAASRDPDEVEDPTRIDIRREAVPHYTFGVGPHRCIGSNLARLELQVVVEQWLERIPTFELKPGTTPQYETGILRLMTSLDLVF
jgi:cytochrome P450